MRRARSALILLPLIALAACGGDDDSFPREEFVEIVTANGVTEAVAECTYDAIVDDEEIMADLREAGGPTDEISSRSAERLSKVIAACLLGLEIGDVDDLGPTTTTEPGRTDDTSADEPGGEDATPTSRRDPGDDRPTTTDGFGTRPGSGSR